jgi:hypothetical protein
MRCLLFLANVPRFFIFYHRIKIFAYAGSAALKNEKTKIHM